jgi:hypothetical protein
MAAQLLAVQVFPILQNLCVKVTSSSRSKACLSWASNDALVSSADHRFPQQALFPSIFRFQVGWVLQAPPSECFLAAPGIPSSATRRTRKLLQAV